VITGGHIIIYSADHEADLAFFRDVLGWPHVDVGGGRLFFKLPPAELAVHEAERNDTHELYLTCEDLPAVIATLADKGVTCTPPDDRGWGIVTSIRLPGGGNLGLYQPRHERAIDL
jgi:catechol 2,3-dioxygenase-like lactoylglutathione lyase family enzyme